jgi:ribonuclease P protein component
MADYCFPKREKITHKTDIDNLFDRSLRSFREGSLVLKTTVREKHLANEPECRVLIVVPKRSMKRAVDRNRVKRLLREVYRLNKNDYQLGISQGNKTRLLSVMYIGRNLPSYSLLEKSFTKALLKAGIEKLNKN